MSFMKLSHSHKVIEPKILYFGTPVVLVSTLQEDGTPNLSPISSAWALGWTVLLGLEESAKGKANLERTGECVLNVPDADLWQNVERLAPLTGNNPVPPHKSDKFRYCADKFSAAKLTHTPSDCGAPPRVTECPLQLEAKLQAVHPLANADGRYPVGIVAAEVRVVRVHAREDIILNGNYINPARWNPLIYNFRHYFGLGTALGKTFRAEI